jgi:hypothetical protein
MSEDDINAVLGSGSVLCHADSFSRVLVWLSTVMTLLLAPDTCS